MKLIENENYQEILSQINELIPTIKKSLFVANQISLTLDKLNNYQNKFYSSKQVASILHVGLRTVQRYRSKGYIQYEVIGRRALHLKEDVDNFESVLAHIRTEKIHKRNYEKMKKLIK